MIELRAIEKTYSDGTRALAGVDLVLERGLYGLLGPNGAGKTTLLEILTLGLEPTSGSRRYFGFPDTPRERGRIRGWLGYLPQDLGTPAGLSGRELLAWCAALRDAPASGRRLRARIDALLDAVDLAHAAHRPAASYSGGMKRRLGLAAALVHGPRLLILDEPTAGLDPDERIRLREIVAELAEALPIVFSTHIVEDVAATCARLGVLAGGRLRFDGAPRDLLRGAGVADLETAYARLAEATTDPPGAPS